MVVLVVFVTTCPICLIVLLRMVDVLSVVPMLGAVPGRQLLIKWVMALVRERLRSASTLPTVLWAFDEIPRSATPPLDRIRPLVTTWYLN